jgi:two-component system sensor histidine kinase KdpD
MMFGTYFVVALVVGHFTTRLRERERAERKREERATSLYRLTRALAASRDLGEALRTVEQIIRESFHADSAVLLRDAAGISPHPASTLQLSAKDESVAAWAFQKKQAAGRSTTTLPDAEALHLPLLAGDRAEGVLAIRLPGTLPPDQRELLDAFVAQLAVFLEKEHAVQTNRETQIAAQSERLQKALFDSISHELKTPLAVLSGALEQAEPDTGEMRQAVRRLTRTVGLLLDATRLESGQLRLSREWCDAAELASEAIAMAEVDRRRVNLHVDPEIPPLRVDAGLFAQALSLVLSNAAHYSPADSPIELAVSWDAEAATFAVLDRGPGFAAGEEVRAFEKFHRGAGQVPGGLGLGLSIARQLIEAHGGTIGAQNRDGGGARVWIRVPAIERPTLPAA